MNLAHLYHCRNVRQAAAAYLAHDWMRTKKHCSNLRKFINDYFEFRRLGFSVSDAVNLSKVAL